MLLNSIKMVKKLNQDLDEYCTEGQFYPEAQLCPALIHKNRYQLLLTSFTQLLMATGH